MSKQMTRPEVKEQHEYIRIALGNNRGLSISFGSCKATGKVPMEVFTAWDKATRFDEATLKSIGLEKVGATYGKVAHAFAEALPTMWPGWNEAPVVPVVGSSVTLNFGRRKGTDVGVVEKVKGTMVTARFAVQGLVSFPADMLAA